MNTFNYPMNDERNQIFFALARPLTPRRIRRLRLRRTLTRVFLTAAVATAALI